MTKSLIVVALTALMLAIGGCAGDPPQQKLSDAVVTPSSSGSAYYGPSMVPNRFLE